MMPSSIQEQEKTQPWLNQFDKRPGDRELAEALLDSINNWLFAGSLCSGKRAAAIMSLIQSAGINRHDRPMPISKMC